MVLRTDELNQGNMPQTLTREININLGNQLSFNPKSPQGMLLTHIKIMLPISIKAFRNIKTQNTLDALN